MSLCLYVNKREKGVVYVALSVDNNLLIGDAEALLPQKMDMY